MRRLWREDAAWILGPLVAAGLGVAGWIVYRQWTEPVHLCCTYGW